MEFIEDNLFYIIIIGFAIFFLFSYRRMFTGGGSRGFSLDQFTEDLTEKARQGMDPIIGREEEIKQVIQTLSRKTKNNPILLGEAGVGKTAVVEGLAIKMVTGDVPSGLANKKILALDLAKVISGTKYRGELEERFKQIIDAVVGANRQIILFIDEIHMLMQTKGTEGAMNLSDIMKPTLARGDLQLIGATTNDEYKEYIDIDEALARRFRSVNVGEPSESETLKILQGVRKNYEEYHKVRFTDEALEMIVELADDHIKNRKFPDKAIDLVDESGARVNIKTYQTPDSSIVLMSDAAKGVRLKMEKAPAEVKKLKNRLDELKLKKEKTDGKSQREKITREMLDITSDIQEVEERIQEEKSAEKYDDQWPEVRPEHIRNIVKEWSGE